MGDTRSASGRWYMRRVRAMERSGFTLIELMIVVAIIGIIVAIAIPNFMTYRTKARQSEVKLQLKAIFTSEIAYFGDNNFFTDDIDALGMKIEPDVVYRYAVGAKEAGNADPGGSPMDNAPPGADEYNFTAIGWANIDGDPAVDTWQISKHYTTLNVYNDVEE